MNQTICPKCGSSNVGEDKSNNLANIAYMNPYKLCQDCNYSAQTFPEVDQENQEKTQEKIKETSDTLPETNVDVRYGKFYWVYIKVGALIIAAFILIFILYKIFF
jgi:hypothetical protein